MLCFQDAGFSGIGSVTPDSISPLAALPSLRPVDAQINAIRAPLTAGNKTIDQILLIGGRKASDLA